MDPALLGVLTALALADSLNPFTVASQAYLLGTPRPMRRSLAFLAGTYAAYFAGGVLLLEGWSVLMGRVLPLVPAWGYAAGEVALGAALAGFAAWSWRRARGGSPVTPPASLGVGATLAFAAASTAADLSSALPYFAAVSRIAAEVPGWGARLGLLAWYNLLYVSPLLLLCAARAGLGPARSERFFGRARAAVDWAFARLLPPLLLLAGLALLVDGARRLAAG